MLARHAHPFHASRWILLRSWSCERPSSRSHVPISCFPTPHFLETLNCVTELVKTPSVSWSWLALRISHRSNFNSPSWNEVSCERKRKAIDDKKSDDLVPTMVAAPMCTLQTPEGTVGAEEKRRVDRACTACSVHVRVRDGNCPFDANAVTSNGDTLRSGSANL